MRPGRVHVDRGADRHKLYRHVDRRFGRRNARRRRALDDTIYGSAGADTLIGGTGNDTINYGSSASGVTARLDGTAGTGGDAAGDILSGFEIAVGSGYNDSLYGTLTAETFYGGNGDDMIDAGAGADTLYGEAGNDTLIGGAGADTMDGGSGTDTASYAGSTSGVTAYLNGTSGSGGDATGR